MNPPRESFRRRLQRIKERKRPPVWPSGVILILAGLAAGWLRPQPSSEAQAFGRAIGQAALISAGVIMIWWDLARRH